MPNNIGKKQGLLYACNMILAFYFLCPLAVVYFGLRALALWK